MLTNSFRTLRERQTVLRQAIDVAWPQDDGQSARQLVQVYDGGSMPTAPDHFFACHPAELDCPETEGSPCPPVVDSSTTIFVDFLRGVPRPNDLAVATAVGGRWVAEIGGCKPTNICLVACGGVPIVGALIQLFDGTTLVDQCTTGVNGCCKFTQCGKFTVKVTVGGTIVNVALRTLNGTAITIPLGGGANVVCCGGYAIPYNLTLTDGAGSLSFIYYPNSFFPTWYGGHAVQQASCFVTTPNNICVAAPASQGPVRVCYQMICYAGQTPTFAIQRSWSWVYGPGTLDPVWYQDPSGFVAGQPCTTGPPAMCGSPHTDVSTDAKNPTTTTPFAISFNPMPAISNYTGDPVGGSVAISG